MPRHASTYWQDYPSTATLTRAQDQNDWEASHDSAVGPLRTAPVRARYKLSADAPLNSATNAQLTGWTKVNDSDNIFASNAWTIPLPSRQWRVRAGLRFGGSAGGGYRYIYLVINSTTVTTASILAQGGGIVAAALAAPGDYCYTEYDGPLNQNDVIRVFAVQSSGAQLTISAASQAANYGDTWIAIKDDGPA